jgi:hypothetical protein
VAEGLLCSRGKQGAKCGKMTWHGRCSSSWIGRWRNGRAEGRGLEYWRIPLKVPTQSYKVILAVLTSHLSSQCTGH